MRKYKDGGFIWINAYRNRHSLASPFTVCSADWPQARWAPSCWSLTHSAFNASPCLHDQVERLTKENTHAGGKSWFFARFSCSQLEKKLPYHWCWRSLSLSSGVSLRGPHNKSSATISPRPSARATTPPCTTASWFTLPVQRRLHWGAHAQTVCNKSATSLQGSCVIKDVQSWHVQPRSPSPPRQNTAPILASYQRRDVDYYQTQSINCWTVGQRSVLLRAAIAPASERNGGKFSLICRQILSPIKI